MSDCINIDGVAYYASSIKAMNKELELYKRCHNSVTEACCVFQNIADYIKALETQNSQYKRIIINLNSSRPDDWSGAQGNLGW